MTLQRVSAITLVYFFMRSLTQFARQASNFIPLVIVLLAAGAQFRGTLLMLLGVALPLIILVHTLLSWWFFRYHVSAKALHICQGVVRRKQLTLDFDRIQQADVREPWYFRPFNLAILGLESAGSDAQEVEIAGLSMSTAHALKERMLSIETSTEQPAATEPPTPLLQLPTSEIARYGLIHNPILLLLPVLAYPLSQTNAIEAYLMPQLDDLTQTLQHGLPLEHVWLLAGLLAITALIAVIGLSVLLALMRYHGFTLYQLGPRYEARMGLFSVTSRSFQSRRLQRVSMQQNALAKLLARVSLRVNQSGQGSQHQPDQVFFIPVLDPRRATKMVKELGLEHPTWCRPHLAGCILPWLLTSIAITLLVWLISELQTSAAVHALWVSAVVGLPIQWLRWRKLGVHLGQRWLATRHGFIGEQQRYIPSVKIQQLTLHQGPWLRLWGCSSLRVYSAAGRETLSWYRTDDIKALQQSLLQRSASYRGYWM